MFGLNGGTTLGLLVPRGGGEDIPLVKRRLTVGRRDSCDICLKFSNISTRHCELELVEGYWQIRDLGSSNGTKVNGERVEAKWLMPGDEIGFAKHFYTIQYTAVGQVPQALGEVSTQVSLLEKAGLANREILRKPERESAQRSTRTPPPKSENSPSPPPDRTSEDDAFDWISG